MMAEKVKRSASKIPVLQKTKRICSSSSKIVSTDPRDLSMQRSLELNKKNDERNMKRFVSDEKENHKDLLFKPDQQALESILTNKGIIPGATMRISEVTHVTNPSTPFSDQLQMNRLSMWSSYKEYEERLQGFGILKNDGSTSRSYILKHSNSRTEAATTPQAPPDSLKVENVTAAPEYNWSTSYRRPKNERNSLLQSIEEHKENVRIFREKVQAVSQTLESQPVKQNTGNMVRSVSSCASGSGNSQRSWREFKENRHAIGEYKMPTAISTLRKNSKSYKSNEPYSLQHTTNCSSNKRPLFPSLMESEETVKSLSSNKFKQLQIGSDGTVRKASRHVDMITSGHLIHNTTSHNKGILSSSAAHFTSPHLLSTSRFTQDLPTFSVTVTPDKSRGLISDLSSTPECTWICQKAICTPVHATIPKPTNCALDEFEVPCSGSVKTSTYCRTSTDIPQRLEHSEKFNSVKASEPLYAGTNASLLPSSNLISDKFSKITLSYKTLSKNSPADIQLSHKEQHNLASALQPKNKPSLKVGTTYSSLSPGPARVLMMSTAISPASRVLTHTGTSSVMSAFQGFRAYDTDKRLLVTPQAQTLGPWFQHQKSPATPMLPFNYHPSTRSQVLSSCLKTSEYRFVGSSHDPPVRKASSSVKKLRWADVQNSSIDVED